MNIDAIILEDDMTPEVTFNNAFTHLGHTMSVHLFNNRANGDISWTVETVDSRTIEGGLYPVNHAEIDACYLITEELEKMPEAFGMSEAVTALFNAIAIMKETN